MGANRAAEAGVLLEERPVVTFLYYLLLDEVTAGRVGEITERVVEMPIGVLHRYENEHLARYAAEIADKLGCGTPPITVRRGTPVDEIRD